MSENLERETDPENGTAATGPLPPAKEPAFGGPRHRRRRFVILGAAGALLLAVGAGGGAIAATQWSTTGTTASSGGGTGTFGQPGTSAGGSTGQDNPFHWRNGSGGPADSGSSETTPGTTASASQATGVVTVVSTLGYQSAKAAGTGIVLTSSGVVLTNNHVIEGATAVQVTVESTGRTYTATVVGTDPTHDVAVLRLANASGLATARTSSTAAQVGQAVTAVGNAGGTGTLTAVSGTVTALKQSITTASEGSANSERLTGLIETDADIVSGDSGGPLLNASGAVIGIDTAASSGTSQVTGYAITIGSALRIAETILSGQDTADTTIGLPAFLGVAVAGTTSSGAVLGSVADGTPAAVAGLAPGDTITAVDGRSVAASGLTAALHAHSPGDTVKVTFTDRSGDSSTVPVTLTTGPAD
jgi:S1-C subfamily serine protease